MATKKTHRAKTSYHGVAINGGTGRLCFQSSGLIYYSNEEGSRKIKMGWGSVALEQFHEDSFSFEVHHNSGGSHFFQMKDEQDYAQLEQDYTLRMEEYYEALSQEAGQDSLAGNRSKHSRPGDLGDSFRSEALGDSSHLEFDLLGSNDLNHVWPSSTPTPARTEDGYPLPATCGKKPSKNTLNIERAKTTYHNVLANGGIGNLRFTAGGLVYYPDQESTRKIKMGWGNVAGEQFHPYSLSLEVHHIAGNSNLFQVKDTHDYQLIQQDYALRLENFYKKEGGEEGMMPSTWDDSFNSEALGDSMTFEHGFPDTTYPGHLVHSSALMPVPETEEGSPLPASSQGPDVERARSSYHGVTCNGCTGKLCFASGGLIHYPDQECARKIKTGWGNVASEQFYPGSHSFEVDHTDGSSHLFQMKDGRDYLQVEEEYAARMEAFYET